MFQSLAPALNSYGYLAVTGFVFLEDFGIPVPGETILIAAAVYAGAGKLNVVLVGVLALAAAILGDNVGFAIGHFGGRPLVLRAGRFVMLTHERLDKAESWFDRHGGKVVAGARFIEGLRQVNGIVAGVTRMHWAKFLTFNAIGAALWVGVWTTIGYVSGSHLDAVYGTLSKVFLYIVAVVVAIVVARIGWHLYRRRKNRGTDRAGSSAASEEPCEAAYSVDESRHPSNADG